MSQPSASHPSPEVVRVLGVDTLSPDAFAPFGTVIPPRPDGTIFGPDDAQLDLTAGTPRFYTMRIPARGLTVRSITHHRDVTQALASAGGNEWFVAVAPPGDLDVDDIKAFRIPGDTAVMLHAGTWHAGPLFEGADQSFFNLELSDTNEIDHHSVDLADRDDVVLRLVTD